MAILLERPIISVDVVVFLILNAELMVLTRRRDKEPFLGAPSLPGVAVHLDECLVDAARRALKEKTYPVFRSGDHIFLDQLATFDGLYRDPRGRTISVAYMGLTRDPPVNTDVVKWLTVSALPKGSLPFDHDDIVKAAVERLRGKLRYTNIAKGFLPDQFRIDEIQNVYEAILRCRLNRTNFRNKLLKIGIIEKQSILSDAVGKKGGRPPHLYRFTQDLIEAVDRDFL